MNILLHQIVFGTIRCISIQYLRANCTRMQSWNKIRDGRFDFIRLRYSGRIHTCNKLNTRMFTGLSATVREHLLYHPWATLARLVNNTCTARERHLHYICETLARLVSITCTVRSLHRQVSCRTKKQDWDKDIFGKILYAFCRDTSSKYFFPGFK